ncbi:hypothetical protein ACFW2E_03820, partial [Streptomyces sp. NPDC058964]
MTSGARTTPARTSPARTAPVRATATLGAVALLTAVLSACGASAGDDRHPGHRSFALHGHTLTVDSDDSALELVAAGSDKAGTVEVTRWFRGSVVVGSDPKVSWSMKGDRLVLRVRCSGFVADCWRGPPPPGCAGRHGTGVGGVARGA